MPGVRRLPPAALSGMQRQQEVRSSQPLHRRIRRAQVHELRRGGPRQVHLLLTQRGPITTTRTELVNEVDHKGNT